MVARSSAHCVHVCNLSRYRPRDGRDRSGVEAMWHSMPVCWCGGSSCDTAELMLPTGRDTTIWFVVPPCRCAGGESGGFAIVRPMSVGPHVTVEYMHSTDVVGQPESCCVEVSTRSLCTQRAPCWCSCRPPQALVNQASCSQKRLRQQLLCRLLGGALGRWRARRFCCLPVGRYAELDLMPVFRE